MTGSETIEQAMVDNESLTRVERLLLQYPEVSESELLEITNFLRDGTILEIGLLSMNQTAWQNAERIRAKHPGRFATTSREYFVVVSAIFGIALVLALFLVIAI